MSTQRFFLLLILPLLFTLNSSRSALPQDHSRDAKWQLWTSGKTELRGANIYQQQAYRDPWCSKAESADFKALREAGANYVNLSIPGPFNVDPPYQQNDAFVDELDRLVGFAKLNNLKVVIALRTGPGRGEGDITESGNHRRNLFFDSNAQDQFVAMWAFVAKKLNTENHVVGYDLLTEPTWKKADRINEAQFQKNWRDLARRTIAAIRAVDTQTPILVEPNDWASPSGLLKWNPLFPKKIEPQYKIVYAVHQYDPYEYTHEKDPLDPEMKKLKEVFKGLDRFRKTHDVPLVVNEFGVKFSRPDAVSFLKKEFELLEQYGMNHAIWIWEPADRSCSGQTFDINAGEAAPVLAVVRDNWKRNKREGKNSNVVVASTPDDEVRININFNDQQPGRYRGDRLKANWPGLVSASTDRAQVVSSVDALRGRDGKCLKVTYPAGKIRSKESGAWFKVRLEPRNERFLDYYVRFGHGNGDHWEFRRGGKLPGLAGGKCNTGGNRSTGDGWSVRYMWREEGRMVAYVYHMNQKGDHADQWPLNCKFRAGQWYRLTQRVRVNSADKEDGVLQIWVDGELVLDRKYIRYRTGSQAPVDNFLFSSFFGGSNSTWAPRKESFAYFDEFQIQTQPLFKLPAKAKLNKK